MRSIEVSNSFPKDQTVGISRRIPFAFTLEPSVRVQSASFGITGLITQAQPRLEFPAVGLMKSVE
jgi:hypothetical protein